MYPSGQRFPVSYYQQGNYQQNFQWRPFMRPGNYHRTNSTHNNVTSNIEYERHWCETCDRGFPNIESLENHKQQHQRCNIDGCQFVAHPKVITKHIQMQHSTGLYKKIAKLSNPEEVTKWIEERKKKYPTKLNIEKKSAQIKEKIERGEKMGLQSKGHHKFNSTDISAKRKHNFNNYQCHKNNNNRNHINKSKSQQNVNPFKKQPASREFHVNVLPDCDKKLKPFAGIQHIDMEIDAEENVDQGDNVLLIDDDLDENCESNAIQNPQEPTVCSALTALMCNYDSSEEETEVVNENKECNVNYLKSTGLSKETVSKACELPIDKAVDRNSSQKNKTDYKEHVNENKKEYDTKDKVAENDRKLHDVPTMVNLVTKPNEDNSDIDSGPEEVKVVKNTVHETNTDNNHSKDKYEAIKKRSAGSNFTKRAFNKPKHKLPSTLLQKLLQREMQHERNVILQCIRHIVRNNYFSKS